MAMTLRGNKKAPFARFSWILIIIVIIFVLIMANILMEVLSHIQMNTIVSPGAFGFSQIVKASRKSGMNATLARMRHVTSDIQVNSVLPNCGLKERCPPTSFPVHVYSGEDKNDQPQICIRGKYYSGTTSSPSGRGINLVVVNPQPLYVVDMRTFDTYQQSGNEMVAYLEENTTAGDILIFVTFDEASANLGDNARKALFDLGSGKIQNLLFRSQWYMISQKGIIGFTPYEELNLSKNSKWAPPINLHLCTPKKIRGQMISPDPPPRENAMRVAFCKKYKEFGSFCNVENINEPIIPAMLTQRNFVGNPVFSTPVIVLASHHQQSLLLTLETLIRQPGINPRHVVVLHRHGWVQAAELVALFGFHSLPVGLTPSWKRLEMGLEYSRSKFPSQKYVIIIHEGVMLAPDFLYYCAQMLPVLQKDETILSASAWNPNGFEGVSSNPSLAYRIDGFPGIGFLMSMKVYETYMMGRMEACCTNLPWLGWSIESEPEKHHIVVPDVSRVLLRLVDHLSNSSVSQALLQRHRVTQLQTSKWIDSPMVLVSDKYYQKVEELISSSFPIYMNQNDLNKCVHRKPINFLKELVKASGQNYALFYEDSDPEKQELLKLLCECFLLAYGSDLKPRGTYKHTLRFTVNGNNIFLVDVKSAFFKLKPSDHKAMKSLGS